LSLRLENLAAAGRKALVGFITAGDPDAAATVPALHALVAGGADVLELGVPFSDPEAEGPAIQRSSERALANGIGLQDCLEMVRQFRERDPDTPIVLMGYLNSIIAMGEETFAQRASQAGADGVIMVNLPPEEAAVLSTALRKADMDLVFLIAPTTTAERTRKIVAQGSGFLYYVTLKGITGADHLDVASVGERVTEIRRQATVPVLAGFGIKDASSAKALAAHADGVVVGSALVNTMAEISDPDQRVAALTRQMAELRAGVDSAG
jgi:tryptophan synthase alpha chain